MYQAIFESRLLRSAQCEAGQMPEDYSAQYDEFRALAQGVLFSEAGYLAIASVLDEVLGLLEEGLENKKKNVA